METFRRFLAQARELWSGLGLARRAAIVAATLGVFVAVGALAYLNPGERYVPIPPGIMAPDEVAAIRTRLTADSIPFRLTGGGTGIEVPEDRYAGARVTLAAAGIPATGGKGWELWDENSLMTTPFAQNVNYQRSLQAELARSIMQMESVQSARVLVARSEQSPFFRDQKPVTASVVLKLKPGTSMSRTTAASIVSLVARSVEGLQPENVTVVDSAGRLLSDPHAGDRDQLPTPQLEYRRELEAYLASKAEAMLNQHLGAGRAVVQVSADINFQHEKVKETVYTPDGKVAKAELTTTSKSTGGGGGRGPVGAVSNVSRAGGTTAAGGGSSSNQETTQTDYLVSEKQSEIESKLGAVTRLSVAALVDLTPQAEGQTTISEANAQELIKKAVGFRPGRDEVTLTNVRLAGPVGPPEPDEALVRLQRVQVYVGLARNISLALAVVLVVLIGALLLLRGRRPAPTPAAAGEDERRRADLARLLDLARAEPDRVAAIFRALLGAPAG